MRLQRNRLFAAVLLIGFVMQSAPLFAQVVEKMPQDQIGTVVFEIKHDYDRIYNVIAAYAADSREVNVTTADRKSKIIGVRAPERILSSIAFDVKRFDVPPPPPEKIETRVFTIKYDFDQLIRVLESFAGSRRSHLELSWDHDTHDTRTIIVSAPSSVVSEIEGIIKKYDVPPPPVKNIELTIYMVEAMSHGKPAPGSSTTAWRFPSGAFVDPEEGPIRVPPVLDDVIAELSQLFVYTHYRSLESTVIRVRENTGGDVRGSFSPYEDNETGEAPSFTVQFSRANVTEDSNGLSIGIDNFSVNVSIPFRQYKEAVNTDAGGVVTATRFQTHSARLQTNIDIRDGQKVVVGKTNIVGAEDVKSDGALFVVVTAKVVD